MQLSWLLGKQNMEIPEGWKKFFYVPVKKSKIWNAKLKKKKKRKLVRDKIKTEHENTAFCMKNLAKKNYFPEW